MGSILLVHIVAGGLAIVAGYVALSAAKGARLHRRSGMFFVCAMVVMGLSGSAIAAVRGVEGSVLGGLFAAYLVFTALTTVHPPAAASRRLDIGAMLLALAVGLSYVTMGTQTLARGGRAVDGVPVGMFFLLGTVALLAGASDVRAIRSGRRRGAPRLARHLWRMCFALWIATGSFFLGQADVFPRPVRIPALLALPVLAVLVTMLYWLWRVGVRRTVRGITGVGAREAIVNDTPPRVVGVG